jgi:hypothetical protein
VLRSRGLESLARPPGSGYNRLRFPDQPARRISQSIVPDKPNKNLLCIVVDRLHAGMLGAYGNSWIHTSAIDRLACESFVFDQAFLESPRLDDIYAAYWLGTHAGRPVSATGASLPGVLSAAGLHTALVSDEPAVFDLPSAADFAQSLRLAPRAASTARDVSETALGRLFAQAMQWLDEAPQPFCLWLHARGMGAPWDAPLALRAAFAAEDDPVPPPLVEVPNYRLPDEHDPDEVLGVRHAYAGQVTVLDQCVAALCEHLETSGLCERTQLTFLSARGFPLGEHGRIGACDEPLFNESTQLPWLMRFPDGLGKLARSSALVQPFDLPGTLLDWLGLDRAGLGLPMPSLLDVVAGRRDMLRDRVLLVSQTERALRTPGWYLRLPAGSAAELYAKPSDRWEVNEVASRAGDVVASLQEALAELEDRGSGDGLPPLPEPLLAEPD